MDVAAFIQATGDAGMEIDTDTVPAGGLPYSLYYSSFLSSSILSGVNIEFSRFTKKGYSLSGNLFVYGF